MEYKKVVNNIYAMKSHQFEYSSLVTKRESILGLTNNIVHTLA